MNRSTRNLIVIKLYTTLRAHGISGGVLGGKPLFHEFSARWSDFSVRISQYLSWRIRMSLKKMLLLIEIDEKSFFKQGTGLRPSSNYDYINYLQLFLLTAVSKPLVFYISVSKMAFTLFHRPLKRNLRIAWNDWTLFRYSRRLEFWSKKLYNCFIIISLNFTFQQWFSEKVRQNWLTEIEKNRDSSWITKTVEITANTQTRLEGFETYIYKHKKKEKDALKYFFNILLDIKVH